MGKQPNRISPCLFNPINIVKVAFIGLYLQFFVTLISSSNIDNQIHIILQNSLYKQYIYEQLVAT